MKTLQAFIETYQPKRIEITVSKDKIKELETKVDNFTYAFASDPTQKIADLVLDYMGTIVYFKEDK